MPARRGIDSLGSFYQWGMNGTKYYYKTGDIRGRKTALESSRRQGVAIHAQRMKDQKEGIAKYGESLVIY